MKVNLTAKALKQLEKINEPYKTKIKLALMRLALEPPEGDIKPLEGIDKYRLRTGSYRIIFRTIDGQILVSGIHPRGQAYKGGNL